MDDRPIGVFDSGIGGLTVLKELACVLPNESFVYFGDTARLPYGARSKETIIKYAHQCINFLLSKDVKAIVVACNTASAAALPVMKESFKEPIIGVIEPGAAAAVEANKNNKIGILGTCATIKSGAYEDEIKKLCPGKRIVSNPCPLFVPIVEEGWAETEVAKIVAKEYLKPLIEEKVDTIVMGCTHYPLLKSVVADIMGSDVCLIDPAHNTAIEFKKVLYKKQIQNENKNISPYYKYYVSDDPERFVKVGSEFLEKDIDNIEKIDIEGYN